MTLLTMPPYCSEFLSTLPNVIYHTTAIWRSVQQRDTMS